MASPNELYALLADGSEINIVCHNDPDCLSSVPALGRIAGAAGIDDRSILYSGDISHQETRAFVDHRIHFSARSPDARVHAGDVPCEAFADIWHVGGHHDVAGG